MKSCFKCGVEKPLAEFYKHPMMGDGHLNKCKDCTKADAAARYARITATPEGLAAERKRGREKHARLYSVGPNWRSPDAPEGVRRHARNKLNNAVRGGRVQKPSVCDECGKGGRIGGHHEDYSRPLAVEWLCPACHRRRHATHPERVRRSA